MLMTALSVLALVANAHLRTFAAGVHSDTMSEATTIAHAAVKMDIGVNRSKWFNDCPDAADDCNFKNEHGELLSQVDCQTEHNSRAMYAKWIPAEAKVLEIGARYGQTTCALAKRLAGKGTLTSVEADARVWDVLEENLKTHGCKFEHFRLIKGVVGPKDKDVSQPEDSGRGGYGTHTSLKRPGLAPAHPLAEIGHVDTLAIDCEGCFATFLEDNPGLEPMLKLILLESHVDQSDKEENKMREMVASKQWTLLDMFSRQRVLCRAGADCPVVDSSC